MYNKGFFKKHNVCIFCESTNRKKFLVYFHQTVNKKITVLYLQKIAIYKKKFEQFYCQWYFFKWWRIASFEVELSWKFCFILLSYPRRPRNASWWSLVPRKNWELLHKEEHPEGTSRRECSEIRDNSNENVSNDYNANV
jgi:hypothetical protein